MLIDAVDFLVVATVGPAAVAGVLLLLIRVWPDYEGGSGLYRFAADGRHFPQLASEQ
jgi:hypothetical protein